MNIIEEHMSRSGSLPAAPQRATREEAEADEARGIELRAFLDLLPTLTKEQWTAAYTVALSYLTPSPQPSPLAAAWDEAWNLAGWYRREARDRMWFHVRYSFRSGDWVAASIVEWALLATVARGLAPRGVCDVLTAPLRTAGIDFDNLHAASEHAHHWTYDGSRWICRLCGTWQDPGPDEEWSRQEP